MRNHFLIYLAHSHNGQMITTRDGVFDQSAVFSKTKT